MKKWLWLFIFAFPLAAQVSQPNPQSRVAGRFVAFNYGQWNVGLYQPPAGTGSQTFSVSTATVQLPDGRQVMPFATNAPLYVGTEKVTVSAVGSGCVLNTVQPGACVLTATFANPHTNAERVSSATFGLQEALDDAGASGGGAATIDSAWENSGGTTAIKNAATLPSNTAIEDVRTGTGGSSYTLPIATTTVLGGIKPDGTTITVNGSTGVASATGGGSGPVQTCDASTMSNYVPGVCIGALTNAQLLSYDGTIATRISVIAAPGSGKIIDPSTVSAQYVYSTSAFNNNCGIKGSLGATAVQPAANLTPACNQTSDQYGIQGGWGFANAAASGIDNQPFGLYLAGTVTGGPPIAIATSSLDSSGDATSVAEGVTISSGQAGTGYLDGDTVQLGCGYGFGVTTSGGAVTALTPFINGTGCVSGTDQATTTDSIAGTGLELDVASVDAGWAVNDTFNDSNCSNDVATGHITSVDSQKLITGYVIDTPGEGCAVGGGDILVAQTGISFAGSNDTNGTISIDTVTSFNSLLYAIYFTVLPIT